MKEYIMGIISGSSIIVCALVFMGQTVAEKENDFEYDLVVNARFDICWNKPYYFKNLNNNQFHIPIHPDASSYGWPDQGPEILDHIFASNTVWMKQYSNMFDYLDEYTSPGQCPQWKTISHHFLTVWHFRKMGWLTKEMIEFSFPACIVEMSTCKNKVHQNKNASPVFWILRLKTQFENLTIEDLKNKI